MPTFSYFLLIRNFGVQITTVCVIHHNAKAPLVHKGFLVCDDVRVSHGLEYMNLNARLG